ncbi:hypothetical protein GDO78_023211 [Eleutherodactylus coqui]|uniref:Uncharacterized protein n=1 Tax=Eleutherodactylus coqui TaxID=57060 RepID=A0A8J6B2D1_ELECQ|nr:hypothetical protein GDO78_023211 [Eleutherodactylus coqui]
MHMETLPVCNVLCMDSVLIRSPNKGCMIHREIVHAAIYFSCVSIGSVHTQVCMEQWKPIYFHCLHSPHIAHACNACVIRGEKKHVDMSPNWG